jgi:hypothetical protein
MTGIQARTGQKKQTTDPAFRSISSLPYNWWSRRPTWQSGNFTCNVYLTAMYIWSIHLSLVWMFFLINNKLVWMYVDISMSRYIYVKGVRREYSAVVRILIPGWRASLDHRVPKYKYKKHMNLIGLQVQNRGLQSRWNSYEIEVQECNP